MAKSKSTTASEPQAHWTQVNHVPPETVNVALTERELRQLVAACETSRKGIGRTSLLVYQRIAHEYGLIAKKLDESYAQIAKSEQMKKTKLIYEARGSK